MIGDGIFRDNEAQTRTGNGGMVNKSSRFWMAKHVYAKKEVAENFAWYMRSVGITEDERGCHLLLTLVVGVAGYAAFYVAPLLLVGLKAEGEFDRSWFVVFIPGYIIAAWSWLYEGPFSPYSIATLVLLAYNLEGIKDINYFLVFTPELMFLGGKASVISSYVHPEEFARVGYSNMRLTLLHLFSLACFWGLVGWKLESGTSVSWGVIFIPAFVWLAVYSIQQSLRPMHLLPLSPNFDDAEAVEVRTTEREEIDQYAKLLSVVLPWFPTILLIILKLEGLEFSILWIFLPFWISAGVSLLCIFGFLIQFFAGHFRPVTSENDQAIQAWTAMAP